MHSSSLKKAAQLAFVVSAGFLLSGCGDSIVDEAKEINTPTSLTAGKIITLNDFFQAYSYTKKVTWSEKETKEFGTVAIASVELKIPDNLPEQFGTNLSNVKAKRLESVEKLIQEERDREVKYIQDQIATEKRFEEYDRNREVSDRIKKELAQLGLETNELSVNELNRRLNSNKNLLAQYQQDVNEHLQQRSRWNDQQSFEKETARLVDYVQRTQDTIKKLSKQIELIPQLQEKFIAEVELENNERYAKKLEQAQSYISPIRARQLKEVQEFDANVGAWADLTRLVYNFTFVRDKNDNVQLISGYQTYLWKDGTEGLQPMQLGLVILILGEISQNKDPIDVKSPSPSLKWAYDNLPKEKKYYGDQVVFF